MLDIKFIRNHPDVVRRAVVDKHDDADVDQILQLDKELLAIIPSQENVRAERKALGKSFKGAPPPEAMAKLNELKAQDAALEAERERLERELNSLLMYVPNIPHESVPPGAAAEDNVVQHVRGERPEFSFTPKQHWELGPALDIIDFERGAKISGSAWVVLKRAGARLSRALINLFLQAHTDEHGYTEIFAPLFANRKTMTVSGQLPKFEHQMYRESEGDLFAIPTAEVPLTGLHADEMLASGDLPLSYAAYAESFRREAGAAGLGTRGIIRLHQFSKVELFKITTAEGSYDALEELTGHAEGMLDTLGLHYRRVTLCRGDLGMSSAKTYDLEVWCPGYGDWLEISSCSNFESYQARRGNIRYRDEKGKVQYAHTLNGSGLPIGRTIVALLEHYQREDGSVDIPECLRDFMQADRIVAAGQGS